MNFFKSLVGPSLPYEKPERLVSVNDPGFTYHVSHSKKVSDKKAVTLFEFPPQNPKILNENVLKRFRTLKHPNIVSYIEHITVDRTVVVLTEEVFPLTSFLSSNKCTDDMILWGLFSLANALHFLNVSAKLGHFNVTKNSIYVTKSGEWKLGGLQLVSTLTDPQDYKSYIESSRSLGHLPNNILSEYVDSFAFSKLALQLYPNAPPTLQALISNLATQPVTAFLTHPAVSTPFLTIVYNLDNYAGLDEFSRRAFLQSISKTKLPPLFCRYKLLPFYLDLFRSNMPEASSAVESVLKLAGGLEDDEFVSLVQPYLTKFLSSPDLSTKYVALSNLRHCVSHFSKEYSETLFSCVCQAADHQNDKIRDAALRAMLALIEKLSKSKVVEIANRFEKGISDPSPIVRTNTTVCISKAALKFDKETRRKLLLCGMARAGKDQVKEMRVAAMNGVLDSVNEFSESDLSRNVLPYVVIFLTDSILDVRVKAVECFTKTSEIVIKYVNDLNQKEELDRNSKTPQNVKTPLVEEDTTHLNLKKPADVVYDQMKPQTRITTSPSLWDNNSPNSGNLSPSIQKDDVFSMFENTELKTEQQQIPKQIETLKEAKTIKKEDEDIERLTGLIGKPKSFQKSTQKQKQLAEMDLPDTLQKKSTKTIIFEKTEKVEKQETPLNVDVFTQQVPQKQKQPEQKKELLWGTSNANDDYWDEWSIETHSKQMRLTRIKGGV
ncbi:hypothetical protein EIN_052210, partial [Entamoeba invadens IP1]|uniref:hypothetical protein n=1 Tax=Entamoeba invadens IP1 TaxID=370355 RepID=UPI0002C3EE66